MSGSVPAKTRAFAVRERDLGEVVAVGEQSDGEGMAVGLRQLGPSEAESSGTPSNPSMTCRLMSGLSRMALRVSSSTMSSGLSSALPKGVGVDVARRGLVDESPHILPDAFEHGPVMFRLAGRV